MPAARQWEATRIATRRTRTSCTYWPTSAMRPVASLLQSAQQMLSEPDLHGTLATSLHIVEDRLGHHQASSRAARASASCPRRNNVSLVAGVPRRPPHAVADHHDLAASRARAGSSRSSSSNCSSTWSRMRTRRAAPPPTSRSRSRRRPTGRCASLSSIGLRHERRRRSTAMGWADLVPRDHRGPRRPPAHRSTEENAPARSCRSRCRRAHPSPLPRARLTLTKAR